MIIRFPLSSSVCWRCQLRQQTRRAVVQDGRILGAVGSRQARQQHNLTQPDASTPTSRRPPLQGVRAGEEDNSGHGNVAENLGRSPRPRLSEYPLGRLHGYLGKLQREDIQDLKVGALGQQAKVIVLRDAGVKTVSHRPPTRDIDLGNDEPVDILKRLDDERGLVGQEEVERNIEELRPPSDKLLSWKEFQYIEEQLNEGFTNSQLTKYVQSHQSRQVGDYEGSTENVNLGRTTVPETGVTVSNWMPGISTSSKYFEENAVRGYTSELSFTQKQRLVVRLLRQCWHVDVHEVVESLGEIEVGLSETSLELLLHGGPSPLEKISNDFVTEPGDRIDVFRSRHVIRVTAIRSKAIAIAEAIRDMLKNVHTLTVDLDMLGTQPGSASKSSISQAPSRESNAEGWPSAALLGDLTKITGALLKFVSPSELSIASINSRPGTGLSSSSDAARRLLLTASEAQERISRSIASWNSRSRTLPVEFDQAESLPWSNRVHKWERPTERTQTMPISPNKSAKPQLLHDAKGEYHKQSNSTGSILPRPRDEESNEEHNIEFRNCSQSAEIWDDASHTTTSIIPGYVLRRSCHDESSPSLTQHSSKPTHYLFVPGQQRISQLFVSDDLPESTLSRSVHLRFLPSPWPTVTTQSAYKCPPIRVCLCVDEKDGSTNLESVQADIETDIMDLMMPLSALDVRFQQSRTVQATSLLPKIQQFLQDSQLSLKAGALVTPPTLHFPIEPHLLNSKEGSIFEAEYLFAGLEYRNAFSSCFKGWKLTYTSIEGGKADGRRTEVSLCPSIISATPDGQMLLERKQRGEDLTKRYIANAFDLVRVLEMNEQRTESASGAQRTALSMGMATDDFPYFTRQIDFEEDLSLKMGAVDEA